MSKETVAIAVYMADGHDPIYVQGTRQEIHSLTERIRMSWELYAPIPATTKSMAAHSLAISGMLVNTKQITRVAFVNEAKEIVPPPVGFDLAR